MVKIFFLVVFVFMTSLSSTAFAEERVPVISVNGEGKVEAPPDSATISIGVTSRDRDATKVQAENARVATNLINAVVSLGIDKKNIRTGNYSFQQRFRYDENGKQIFDGYEVNNTVTVNVNDLNKVGKVIDTALSNGANRVDSLNFGIRDRESFQSEALKSAVRDARKKAEIVAAELGKRIVGIVNVSINSAPIMAARTENLMLMGSAKDANFSTPIESGTLSCSASVHIDFEISR